MGLHVITSDGSLRKIFSTSRIGKSRAYEYIEDGIFGDIYPGDLFKALKSYENSEIDSDLIYRLLHLNHKNFAFLPNIGVGEWFRRDNTLLGDHRRNWFQIDIDGAEWDSVSFPNSVRDPHQITVKELARAVLVALGLPSNIEFVAQRSSSAKVAEGIYLRIYVFLDTELDEVGLKAAFNPYSEIDLSMAEKGRLHTTMPPVYADVGVKVKELAGPDIAKQSGELLKVSELRKGTRPPSRYLKQGDQDNTEGRELVWRNLREVFGTDADIPLLDIHDIYSAMKEHSDTYPEKWKSNYACGFFLRESLHRTGFFDEGMKFLMEAPHIRRGLTEKHLKSKKKSILRYELAKRSCGSIEKRFTDTGTSAVKRIHELDMGKLADKDFNEIPTENVIVCLGGAEGTGKTELGKRLINKMMPETSLSVSFRKAVVKSLAQECGQEDYENIDGSEFADSVAQAKRTLMPTCEKLATCIHSIKYTVGEDGSYLSRDVVWIDEIEHCLEELYLGGGFAGKGLSEADADLFERKDLYTNLSRMLRILIDVCQQAKVVILSDAKASDLLTGWFIEQISTYGDKKRFLLDNTADWLADMSATFIDSESEILLKVRDLLAEGKTVAIQTSFANGQDNSHPQMWKWEQAIKQISGLKDSELRSFTSKSFDNQRAITIQNSPNDVIERMLEEGVRVIICSPWNQVGWSYKGTPVDATVSIITNKFIHAEDIKQGLRRWRKTMEHYLFIKQIPQFGMIDSVGKAYGDALGV